MLSVLCPEIFIRIDWSIPAFRIFRWADRRRSWNSNPSWSARLTAAFQEASNFCTCEPGLVRTPPCPSMQSTVCQKKTQGQSGNSASRIPNAIGSEKPPFRKVDPDDLHCGELTAIETLWAEYA